MNENDEEEFLTQIAAGTDIPTAWAANPSLDEPDDQEPTREPDQDAWFPFGCVVVAVLVVVILALMKATIQ